MPLTALILIALSTVFHVAWNIIGKKQTPSVVFFLMSNTCAFITLSPSLLIIEGIGELPDIIWPILGITSIFQAIYFIGLSGAYRKGDMSFVYPLARSLPVVFVACFSLALPHTEPITTKALVGMIIISTGCLLLPLPALADFSLGNFYNRCTLLAVVAAVGTTGYSIIDSYAIRLLKETAPMGMSGTEITIFFLTIETLFTAIALGIFVAATPIERQGILYGLKNQIKPAVISGILVSLAYALILGAMAFVTDVSYVVAFRQLSIPLGAIAGITLLKEPAHPPKLIAVGVIFTGLMMVSIH